MIASVHVALRVGLYRTAHSGDREARRRRNVASRLEIQSAQLRRLQHGQVAFAVRGVTIISLAAKTGGTLGSEMVNHPFGEMIDGCRGCP